MYKFIGLGLGPFNLGLAALSEELSEEKGIFLEKRPVDDLWHSGLLFEFAKLQTSFIKDLVTLASPRSKYSFINYLHQKRSIYKFLNADYEYIQRKEYALYMKWVSESLDNVHYSCAVNHINYDGQKYRVYTDKGDFYSEHIVIGTGQKESVPNLVVGDTNSENLIMARQYLHSFPDNLKGVVVLIGGGQTSAENIRRRKVESQKLASDGISLGILSEVYKELYKRVYIDQQQNRFYIAPDRQLSKLNQTEEGWNLEFSHLSNNCTENLSADTVILSLGQTIQLPGLLEEVLMNLEISTTKFEINDDFSLKSEYLCKNKIYLQGMSKLANGIAEPNLGMSPWRNSIILNSICGREAFSVPDIDRFMVWENLERVFKKCTLC